MGAPSEGDRPDTFGIDEIEIAMRIEEGKITAESQSGPKGGSITLGPDEMSFKLVLEGAGSDLAVATLSRPELVNFRTVVDGVLSAAVTDGEESGLGRSTVYSGYQTLRNFDGAVGLTFDTDTLRELGLVTEEGGIPGGNRQVECTVLGNGTAIVDLTGDDGGFQPGPS